MYSDLIDGFRHNDSMILRCNALASIKCILTHFLHGCLLIHMICCNALASIKCILTFGSPLVLKHGKVSCNALASIKCILTLIDQALWDYYHKVVMPLRALSVF